MTSSLMITDSRWNAPYLFKDAKILQDTYSWNEGQRLADLLDKKILSFRLGKRQDSLFGS